MVFGYVDLVASQAGKRRTVQRRSLHVDSRGTEIECPVECYNFYGAVTDGNRIDKLPWNLDLNRLPFFNLLRNIDTRQEVEA